MYCGTRDGVTSTCISACKSVSGDAHRTIGNVHRYVYSGIRDGVKSRRISAESVGRRSIILSNLTLSVLKTRRE